MKSTAGIRLGVSALLLTALLGGCATMAGWVGIASEKLVEEKAAATETEVAAAQAEIRQLRQELEVYKQKAAALDQLADSMQEAIRSTHQLEELAKVMEARLQALPQETLGLLVQIIQKHLEGGE
jgi:uncharacterized protein YlxW (UPF0749 family)